MARRIYKYTIPCKITARVVQWLGARIQHGAIRIWAEIDDAEPERDWTILPIGTGWEMGGEDEKFLRDGTYCGTIIDDEEYVWHIYAYPNPSLSEMKK